MTTKEASQLIGKPAVLSLPEKSGVLKINVTVIDVKAAFGRVDVLVEPVAGSGQVWRSLGETVAIGSTK